MDIHEELEKRISESSEHSGFTMNHEMLSNQVVIMKALLDIGARVKEIEKNKSVIQATYGFHGTALKDEMPGKYDHLVGKWVMAKADQNIDPEFYEPSVIKGNWYELKKPRRKDGIEFTTEQARLGIIGDKSVNTFFDLTDVRDYKPHEIPPNILAGLMMLPTDHPEYGNLREKAIRNAEKLGLFPGHTMTDPLSIPDCIHSAFDWGKSEEGYDYWFKVRQRSGKGEFDPTTVIPFSYERWQTADYVGLVTRGGIDVNEIEHENDYDSHIIGRALVGGKMLSWYENGTAHWKFDNSYDLFLVVKTK
jgi:hypothetical protein